MLTRDIEGHATVSYMLSRRMAAPRVLAKEAFDQILGKRRALPSRRDADVDLSLYTADLRWDQIAFVLNLNVSHPRQLRDAWYLTD